MLEHLNPSALSVVSPMLLKSLVECEAEVKDKDAKTMITLDAAIQTVSRRSALVYLKRAKEEKKNREFRLKGGGKKTRRGIILENISHAATGGEWEPGWMCWMSNAQRSRGHDAEQRWVCAARKLLASASCVKTRQH